MHDAALPPEQRRALLALKPAAERGFYLAGGTGLCLRLAHRRSFDIDLFRDSEIDPEELLRDLESSGVHASNVRTKPNTLWLEVEGVETSLMYFPYPRVRCPGAAKGTSSRHPGSASSRGVWHPCSALVLLPTTPCAIAATNRR
jgi:hypothetical protein